MIDPDPKPDHDDTEQQSSQDPQDLEEAQKDAAQEREEEGGYQ
jgi:hypothetical protein